MKSRVLIIEDDTELGELVQVYISREGITATLRENAEEGLALLRDEGAELVVLDINLPGMDGYEFLQTFRRESDIPVIIISARESDEDIVLGLGIGADEFVTKPFAPRVLVARVRAMLHRTRDLKPKTVSFGPYVLDLDGYSLVKEGRRIVISTKEFEVLRYLATHPGIPMTPDEIYKGAWGSAYGDLSAVAVYIRRLRQKIEEDPVHPCFLQTIYGRGYRFDPDALRG